MKGKHTLVKSIYTWLGIVAVVVFAAGMGVYINIQTIQDLSSLENRLSNSNQMLSFLDSSHQAILTIESAQRGFILTQDARYLQLYQPAIDTLQTRTKEAQSLLSTTREQQRLIDEWLAYIELKTKEVKDTVKLAEQGDWEQAESIIASFEGLLLYNSIERLFQQIKKNETLVQQQTLETLSAARINSQTTVLLSTVTTTVLVIVLLGFIHLSMRMSQQQQQQESDAKDRFLANLGHELRTPLTSIMGYSELMLEHRQDPTNQARLIIILRNARHLHSLLNDLLDLSKMLAGKLDIQHSDTSLHELLDDVFASMVIAARDKGLSLSIQSSSPLPITIRTDAVRVKQVLINLINNAVKFTESGSIQTVVSVNDDNKIVFAVSDSGCGMAADKLQQIFKPFEQIASDTNARQKGVGLGLAICQQLVARLGGEMHVVSVPAQGSTFSFTIDPGDISASPRNHYTYNETIEVYSADTFPLLHGHVLVVDDLEDLRTLIGHWLRNAGLKVKLAENSTQAIELCQSNTFDLIFMDIHMPDTDGIETLSVIRKQGTETPTIALTAALHEGMEPRLISLGFSSVVGKPVSQSRLYELCSQHLKHKSHIDTQLHFLIAEDDKDAADLLSLLLSAKGVQVSVAHTGKDAFSLITQESITHAIVDLNLPDINGLSLADQLKTARPSLTIFIASGDAPEREQWDEKLITKAFLKPLTQDDILQMLVR